MIGCFSAPKIQGSEGVLKMKRFYLVVFSFFCFLWGTIVWAGIPQVINFQGYLTDASGNPLNGMHTLTFTIYDAATGGDALWSETREVVIKNGVFSVSLGEQNPINLSFDSSYWLGIQVDNDPEMAPRYRLTSAAYSYHAGVAEVAWNISCNGCITKDHLGFTIAAGEGLSSEETPTGIMLSVDYNKVQKKITSNCAEGEVIKKIKEDGSVECIAAGGQYFSGTASTLDIKVNNNRVLRLETSTESPNFIAGHSGNTANGTYGATIGGGGKSGANNRVTDTYGTVSGGVNNVAGNGNNVPDDASYATVSGGRQNSATSEGATVGGGVQNQAKTGFYPTVGGGHGNTASGPMATVGGGRSNTASGQYAMVGGGNNNQAAGFAATIAGGNSNVANGPNSTVGGGNNNEARGDYSMVPGGYGNIARGQYSFAAGRRAKAYSDGCFIWGDATDADVTCSSPNRTVFRSTGGFYIYTNAALSTGVYLNPGSGSWAQLSSRKQKENFKPVDTVALLERLAQIDILTWNYKSQDPSIRHIGPMAEDFNSLLPDLGGEGKQYISSIDADGVALAAIQGLYKLLKEKDALIKAQQTLIETQQLRLEIQESKLETQQKELEALKERLAILEAMVRASGKMFSYKEKE